MEGERDKKESKVIIKPMRVGEPYAVNFYKQTKIGVVWKIIHSYYKVVTIGFTFQAANSGPGIVLTTAYTPSYLNLKTNQWRHYYLRFRNEGCKAQRDPVTFPRSNA